MKITKSQLKQIIKEELENASTLRLPDPAAAKEVNAKLAAIRELMASPFPKNPIGAHKQAVRILEEIKEIVNTEGVYLPHRDATAQLPGGETVHAKGAPK